MLSVRPPDRDTLLQYLAAQRSEAFSYSEVGATLDAIPPGYAVNHTRRMLGHGEAVFEVARSGLQSWCQLQLGWVSSWPLDVPMRQGEHVVVIGRALGLWWLNACRIVYVLDERETTRRFGYAHGTLGDHLACGEERFLIEMDDDQIVWLDILAFSRPQIWLAKLGYPYMRRAQRRFGRESAKSMLRFVDRQTDLTNRPMDRHPFERVR